MKIKYWRKCKSIPVKKLRFRFVFMGMFAMLHGKVHNVRSIPMIPNGFSRYNDIRVLQEQTSNIATILFMAYLLMLIGWQCGICSKTICNIFHGLLIDLTSFCKLGCCMQIYIHFCSDPSDLLQWIWNKTAQHLMLYNKIVAKPTVSISANPSSSIQFGFTLTITATVTANPPPNTTKWQRKPQNGAWSDLDINNSMYAGSSVTPSAPLLVISSITYSEDNVAFRCVVGNAEGETISNDVTIDVTGSM
jgi:hypothetical protein